MMSSMWEKSFLAERRRVRRILPSTPMMASNGTAIHAAPVILPDAEPLSKLYDLFHRILRR